MRLILPVSFCVNLVISLVFISVDIRELLKEAEKSRPDQLLKVLAAFSQNSILETPSIQSQAFIRIVERLTTSSAPDKYVLN